MAPKLSIPVIDVRDAAQAHVNALYHGQDGNRYLVSKLKGESFLQMANILKKEFKDSSYMFPTKEAPKFAVWAMSFFDKRLAHSLPSYGKEFEFNNSKSIKELQVDYCNISLSLTQMAHNLIEIGYIEDLTNKMHLI